MKKSFSLKDHLFNKESVTYLASLFAESDPEFKKEVFIAEVMVKLKKLELKERIVWIAEVLEGHLSKNFKKAARQIQKALPAPLDPSKTDDDFGSFIFAPLGEFVVRNGLSDKHLRTSLKTIHALTQRFSMEDTIRYFINAYPAQTLQALEEWSMHEHYHVRRLVSEGTRPLLPWSGRIALEVTEPVPFLDALHADGTRYVTRSVANHLNDISKKHPKLVVELLTKWRKEEKQELKELQWMTRHALRTLVKKGDKEALALLGYGHNPKIRVQDFTLSPSSENIAPGEILSFSFIITAEENVELMVDYVIDFVKAKGETKPKVFKIKKLKLKKGESAAITKNHRLLADATTFVLHSGKHAVTLQINGKKFDSADFIIH
jgi:3-methyladenine DNA glycosylase AlkC